MTRRSLLPVALLALAVTAARLIYLAFLCPYDLVEDEAHYWEWSRHLDWSYYSKGPGVALAIRAATALFGHTEFAVRLPAALAGGALILAAAWLARALFLPLPEGGGRGEGKATLSVSHTTPASSSPPLLFSSSPLLSPPSRAPLFAALAIILCPVFQLPGILMTIDGPYVACWLIACCAAWSALARASRAAWPALGLALAVGFLFKYTILLLIPGLILFAVIRRRDLALAPRWPAWLALSTLIAAAGLLPVIIWNAQRDWPTLRHLLGHLGLRGGDVAVSANPSRWSPTWTLEFLGAQLAMVGPLLVLALLAWKRSRSTAAAALPRPATAFLISCAAPLFLFYLAVSFIAEPEQNWAIASYTTLLVLAGIAASRLPLPEGGGRGEGKPAPSAPHSTPASCPPLLSPRPRSLTRFLWRAAIVYGLFAAVGLHRIDWVVGLRNAIIFSPPVKSLLASSNNGQGPRPMTPGRLIGPREMAAAAHARLLTIKRDTGLEPFLIAEHYGRASQMAFYLHDHPITYCGSALFGGRRTQYDLWPFTDLANPATLASLDGRPALILTSDHDWKRTQWLTVFESLEPLGKLPGEHKRDRVAYAGSGFKAAAAKARLTPRPSTP